MKRREFLAATVAVGAAATASTLQLQAQGPPTGPRGQGGAGQGAGQGGRRGFPGDRRAEARLRFCCQPGLAPSGSNEERLRWIKATGFDAIEIGNPGNMESARNWKRMADDAGLPVASIYFGGAEIPLMSEDPAVRQRGIDESRARMEIAAAMDCPCLVYVPVRGSQPEEIRNLPERVLWQRTVGVLRDLGPIAAELNTFVVLEPLRRGEAWFMRKVSQAALLAKEANVPGVAALGDTYHMYTEETNSMAAFIAGGDFIKHVHLGSGRGRVLPTAENHSTPGNTHTDAFRGLKYIGYTGVVSFECGIGGSGDARVEVPRCLDYLRQCWEEA